MAEFPKTLKELCTPAMLYFVISIIGLVIVLMQNLGNTNSYHVGSFSCRVPNTAVVFIVKLIYVLFWTWILNIICRDGFEGIAWILDLLPYLLMFNFILTLFIPN